jgi:hypothetical protein
MGYKFNPFTGNLDVVDTTAAAGATTQVQFNDAGAFGGDSGLTFNKTTDALSAGGFIPTSSTVPANGVYLPAANSVGVATNGTGRLFINNGGDIGVGTASPVSRLHVTGGDSVFGSGNLTRILNASQVIDFTNAAQDTYVAGRLNGLNLKFYTATGGGIDITSAGLVGIGTSSPSRNLDVAAGQANVGITSNTTSAGNEPTLVFTHAGNNAYAIKGGNNLQFASDAGANVRMTLTTAGNLGIGNTAPGQALDVVGSINLTGNHIFSTTTSPFIAATAASSVLRFGTGSGGTERFRCDSSGRLLVGTSTSVSTQAGFTPSIQVAGTGALAAMSAQRYAASPSGPGFVFQKSRSGTIGSQAVLVSGDTFGSLTFEGSNGSAFQKGAQIDAEVDGTPGANDMPGRLVFSTTADGASSPTERMRIGNKGNTTITSVADNDAALRVDSNGTSGTQYGIYIETGNDQNDATRTFLGCVGGATTRAQIRSNGGLANYQANDVNLSDINVKKDISPAGDTWDCVKQWEIVNYRYNDQSDDADLNLGVIAQQVAESCPEVITVFQEAKEATEDAPAQEERLGVKEQQMYWMAIKALQEAIARIETLETEVAALKGA